MAGEAAGAEKGLSARVETFSGDSEHWEEFAIELQAYLWCTDPNLVTALGTDRPLAEDQAVTRATWDTRSASIYARLILWTKGTPAGIVAGFAADRNGIGAWTALENKYRYRDNFDLGYYTAKLNSLKTSCARPG